MATVDCEVVAFCCIVPVPPSVKSNASVRHYDITCHKFTSESELVCEFSGHEDQLFFLHRAFSEAVPSRPDVGKVNDDGVGLETLEVKDAVCDAKITAVAPLCGVDHNVCQSCPAKRQCVVTMFDVFGCLTL